jgi:polo-like kinase 1
MNNDKDKKTNDINPENQQIVEEKIIKVTGDIQIRKYLKGKFLGKGGFAKCYEFTNLDSKKLYAAKIVSKASLVKSRSKQKLITEIKIHKALHHPNIVAFEHYFEDHENVYILLELCCNQSINDLLKRRKRLTEIETQCYMVQLIKSLKYLHSHRVIHRDLKLGNLFLTDKMELKGGDFGLAAKLEFEGERKRTVCGTPNYIAPEILDGKTGHSYEVDIWSLGVICYTLIIGKPPFETQDVKATYKRIKANNYSFPEGAVISEYAKSLITEILLTDPVKRPSLDQILAHDFFNQGNSIPKLLPTSTLACPPSLSYIRQFIPDAGPNGIVVKSTKLNTEVNNQNKMSITQDKSTKVGFGGDTKDLNTVISGESRPMTTNNTKFSGKDTKTGGSMSNRDFNNKNQYTNTNDTQNPQLKPPEIWVKKWVDFSSKYGLGYSLTDGCTGVFFNDSSKIILDINGINFHYIERGPDKQEKFNAHTLTKYPDELEKKVKLLRYFKSYLDGEQNIQKQENLESKNTTEDPNSSEQKKNFAYVKKWMRTKHAIMFRLSNKIVQVCFQDHTEIILSSESRVVTYCNKKGDRSSYPLSSALESNNYEMTKRLKYTKDILTHMLTGSTQQNKDKKETGVPTQTTTGTGSGTQGGQQTIN